MTKQRRTFQTAGPVIPSENYFIERRKETAEFLSRIERGKYIVIFAPRQTGKTSFFRQSLDKLTEDASYIPIALDFEVYSDVPSERFYQDVQKILSRHLISRLRTLSIKNLAEIVIVQMMLHKLLLPAAAVFYAGDCVGGDKWDRRKDAKHSVQKEEIMEVIFSVLGSC